MDKWKDFKDQVRKISDKGHRVRLPNTCVYATLADFHRLNW